MKIIAIYGTPYEPGQMVALKIPHVTPTNADRSGDCAPRHGGIVEQRNPHLGQFAHPGGRPRVM